MCAEETSEVVARVLRTEPNVRQPIVERFSVLDGTEGCQIVRVSQEWPLGTSDVDVVYDGDARPIRIWRRTSIPDASGPIGHVDLRVYDLRTTPVQIAHRSSSGEREGVALRGATPRVVIGPGRGIFTPWIQRANLEVDGRLRETAIDVREPLAVIRDVTLTRHANRQVEGLGIVRVYTVYGREPVFTDDDNVVIGDLFGLREASTIDGPLPDPLPDPGPVDPHEGP